MTKFFIILVLSIFIIIGVEVYNENISEEPNVTIKEFEHKGHEYMIIKWSDSYGYTIINNPDCKKCAIYNNYKNK